MKNIVEIWIQSILVWYAYMSLLPQIHQICSALQSTQLWCITSHKSSIPNPAPERYLGGSTGFVMRNSHHPIRVTSPKKYSLKNNQFFQKISGPSAFSHEIPQSLVKSSTSIASHLTLSEKGLPEKKKAWSSHVLIYFLIYGNSQFSNTPKKNKLQKSTLW